MLLYRALPTTPGRVFILGVGSSGLNAAQKIAEEWPESEIHTTDLNDQPPAGLPGIFHQNTDAVDLLNSFLEEGRPDDVVVPCLPVHAAFVYVLSHLGYCIPVPVHLMQEIPGAVSGRDGCVYSSLSDFLCPRECPEPENCCALTGDSRDEPLYKTLSTLKGFASRTFVIRLAVFLPGVGALTSGSLIELLERVRSRKGRYLIGTSSRCHGVLHALTH